MKNNFTLYNSISFTTTTGYNIYMLPSSLFVLKGYSVVIYLNYPNLLAINDRNDSIYSDMYWNGNEYVRLNQFENWAFYFNCKIDQSYFLQSYRFSKIFDFNQTDPIAREDNKRFHLSVRFNLTNNQYKKYFQILNSKNFIFYL